MCNPGDEKSGMEAINKLKSTDPPLFLFPNSDLSLSARIASRYLFASLKPYTPKSPFEQLLTDGFDAEQIWQQIDLQSQPLITSLKREIKRFEKNPDQILSIFVKAEANGGLEREVKENAELGLVGDSDKFEELSDDDDDEGDEEEDEGAEVMEKVELEDDEDEDEDGEEDEEGDEDDSEDVMSDGDGVPEVEDEFLKIKDLEKYLSKEEEREYGSEEKQKKKKNEGKNDVKASMEEGDEDIDDEDEADEVDDELLMYGEDDEDEDGGADIRYEDFFVPNKKAPKRKRKQADESYASEIEDEDDEHKGNLSTYEKERLKLEAKIKEMEEANMAEKDWTMQGEVTAAKRPKDSALEVDLDFEHNVRPPPVITEEVTASLEEIIKKRILEGKFDDVQKAPKLPSTAPRERTKELDDNKSKKGLAEIYEEEYAQQTAPASAPVSHNDQLKTEASKLFKTLCLKLDALSHFHFAPKPVVEDMSVQANVPALAMEEIAPVAVSDAAMLAPEEVFAGKGDIKEETELTKEDRKRRRAKKKRKVKAIKAKRTAERPSENPAQAQIEGKEE